MISLVLPAFNPGPLAVSAWLKLEEFLGGRRVPCEVIFVLDGCTDGTQEQLEQLANRRDHRFRVLSYPLNRGKGYAVRTGLLAARGDVRVFTDVDLAYPFEDILRVAESVCDGAPVAIGSRTHPESWLRVATGSLGRALWRLVQSRIFGSLTRLLLPIEQRDTQAGLKAMTAQVAESLLPHLRCDGFGFDCEFLTACYLCGVPITEVPVCVRFDATTTTSLRTSLRMVRDLWRVRRLWRSRTGYPSLELRPSSSSTRDRARAAKSVAA